MGAEAASEFGEALAGEQETNHLLGHSLYFYSRDSGQPVRFVPPAFAISDITTIPRYRELRVSDSGCRLWWLEYGGNLDTVHQTEEIKWELWRVAYGVWNYIKNSGNFPEAENLTFEWMGTIPGKRESRRFMGDVTLTQNDIIEQRTHPDAVSFGGWAIDLHPPEGIFSPQPGCIQWHSKGVYQIPFRTMYSRNVGNLFLTGRIISATHIAFASTRVMATCAHNGQAAAMAAALCAEQNLLPRSLLSPDRMHMLQQRLLRTGQHIPGVPTRDEADLARRAHITASSTLCLTDLPCSGELAPCARPHALLLPAAAGPLPAMTLYANISEPTTLRAELWRSSRQGNTTPDIFLESTEVALPTGAVVAAEIAFTISLDEDAHLFIIVPPFPAGALYLSKAQAPGLTTLSQRVNAAVAKSAVQRPPEGSGIDTFAFWLPERRPLARNLAARFSPPLDVYQPVKVVNGFARPWCGANAWAPALEDTSPAITLTWDTPQTISSIQITFDTDFDHPMESVLMTHPERVMPGCITTFRVITGEAQVLAHIEENHQTQWRFVLEHPVFTTSVSIEILAHGAGVPAIFEVRCY